MGDRLGFDPGQPPKIKSRRKWAFEVSTEASRQGESWLGFFFFFCLSQTKPEPNTCRARDMFDRRSRARAPISMKLSQIISTGTPAKHKKFQRSPISK
jgi:hypothetical protein